MIGYRRIKQLKTIKVTKSRNLLKKLNQQNKFLMLKKLKTRQKFQNRQRASKYKVDKSNLDRKVSPRIS